MPPHVNTLDALAVLLELFTWIGILGGVLLIPLGFAARVAGRRWVGTTGVIASGPMGPLVRWFDTAGEVHQVDATTPESVGLEPGSDIHVFFSPRRPDRMRTDSPAHDGRALLLLGGILLTIGILSWIAGLLLLFVEGGAGA
jgi:hypothetical protein